ncbi:MAG: DUF4270 domain-containing protein [Bacteroides sp.]|nr:DUF4270 domain-containing protein [Bacteroides sp.]
MLPDTDRVTVHSKTYQAISQTILADSVYSKTRKAYLGKFTDPDFGFYECDFITQFNCVDSFTFNYYDRIVPQEDVKRVSKIELTLAYTNYFGDPDNTSRLSIFELNDRLENEKEHSRYTDFNVEEYYDAWKGAIARKSYIVNTPDYTTTDYNEVTIPLSNDLGDHFLELYEEDRNNFLNTQTFLEHVFNGVYVKSDIGDGTILYIDYIDISLYTDVYAVDSLGNFPIEREEEGYAGEDSITYNAFIGIFNSTYEIFQTNRIQNSELLKERAEET